MQHEAIIAREQEFNRRAFEQNARLARHYGALSRTGPEDMREINKQRAQWYVERAAVFAKGGPRA